MVPWLQEADRMGLSVIKIQFRLPAEDEAFLNGLGSRQRRNRLADSLRPSCFLGPSCPLA